MINTDTAVIPRRRCRWECLHFVPGDDIPLQSERPRPKYFLSHLYSTLTLPVYVSPAPLLLCLSLDNLRRVSSNTTPPSVGLQLVKQRHLIIAEATQSYVCVERRQWSTVSKLPGLSPLSSGYLFVCTYSIYHSLLGRITASACTRAQT